MKRFRMLALAGALCLAVVIARPGALAQSHAADAPARVTFQTADNCLACHNGLVAPSGEDVSIGVAWRASMMANSARDPYWHAAVRRETLDHPSKQAAIEDECAICHMPMSRLAAHGAGRLGEVFRWLPVNAATSEDHRFAGDGVSCTVCHQIGPDRLGTRESFVGGFTLATPEGGSPRMFGPFEVDRGHAALMRSATDAVPTMGEHLRQSEMCATCHTLYTEAFGPDGNVVGSLPEQVPYLEWRHSAFVKERSCQSCHMPEAQSTPVASVLGEPRERLGRHTFLGGNFFMLRMLNRFRDDLGVTALPHELDAAAAATVRQLQVDTATVSLRRVDVVDGRIEAEVDVANLTGHKLPTGYPSRRVWLHLTVRDADGRVVFESGAVGPDGRIAGNDNDDDGRRFEPHYEQIRRGDEVQVYEAIMATPDGRPTTGLLQATRFVKDNRLLPRGFDKGGAEPDIAVVGGAAGDRDFTGAGDRVGYVITTANARAPFAVAVELRYQPIAFRWADNLRAYDAPEPRRFVGYYERMAEASSVVLAHASAVVR